MSTHTVRKVKITSAQIIALRSAEMQDDGSYILPTAKAQTLAALARIGVVTGPRSLTVQGVSVMHTVSHVDVIASKGHTVYLSDAPESLELFTLGERVSEDVADAENGAQSLECTCAPNGDNSWCAKHYPAPVIADGMDTRFPRVEIQGADGFDMTPDMSALTGECYKGCGRPVTGMFCDYVGRTEGVCDFDRDSLGDHITVTPVDPSIWGGASDTGTAVVGVVQNTPGMSGATHYHAPGCRDITREMRRYGQSERDALEFTFNSVAEILTFEYGDIASDNAEENTPEWWANILDNAQYDRSMEYGGMGVKIMPCLSIPMGTDNDGNPLQDKGSFYCFGFRAPSPEKVAEIQAEIAACECGEYDCLYCDTNAREHNVNTCDTRECVTCARALHIMCREGHTGEPCKACEAYVSEGPLSIFRPVTSMVDAPENDDTDAGFVETMVTKEYELSVIVDETTGTRVSLGWVTLEMNAAQCMDFDRVAEEYGRTQNTRTPRHGWASIITVHNVCDL